MTRLVHFSLNMPKSAFTKVALQNHDYQALLLIEQLMLARLSQHYLNEVQEIVCYAIRVNESMQHCFVV